MLNNKAFKEFSTEDEAKEWVNENYGQWLEKIQITQYSYASKNVSDLLSGYSGNMDRVYNQMLRGKREFPKSQSKEFIENINIINNAISKLKLKENIQVWRWTSKNEFKKLFENAKIKKGHTFIDKAFMSTTLVSDLLENFAKSRKYDCLLKLYLPKGTKGAYIDFYDKYHLLNECEFLLPTNTSFVFQKKFFSFKYMKWIYECYLVGQD
ncbi:hypothetical protein CDLVIII_3206 [Clostridium sp. DL-VIII]|uniref:ADP-ribosyltransferase n=1 Tax=Clostridium sp. DL-VIII TaxID=641107 RepID=UPI00023AFFD3|nr:ADP-ribosyltransferase [Clostridium sp. DL-VIII]EHI99780.1 hypothetical protein CDLVIII_3206 [Clostridium sp. DL-VIII]